MSVNGFLNTLTLKPLWDCNRMICLLFEIGEHVAQFDGILRGDCAAVNEVLESVCGLLGVTGLACAENLLFEEPLPEVEPKHGESVRVVGEVRVLGRDSGPRDQAGAELWLA